jgi:hypothetical protein
MRLRARLKTEGSADLGPLRRKAPPSARDRQISLSENQGDTLLHLCAVSVYSIQRSPALCPLLHNCSMRTSGESAMNSSLWWPLDPYFGARHLRRARKLLQSGDDNIHKNLKRCIHGRFSTVLPPKYEGLIFQEFHILHQYWIFSPVCLM